jgi:glycine/D-amino acid oxidase-like deaminating enzyme
VTKTYDFLIVGAGIFGISTAIELRKRNYSVCVLNPDTIPHHLAASTDISKAVRLEYGSDREYFEMTEICLERWREWNEFFQTTLYHEVGFLMLGKESLDSPRHTFEKASIELLHERGYKTEILEQSELAKRFPIINSSLYPLAHYNPVGGYVESGKVVTKLVDLALQLGVQISNHQTVHELQISSGHLTVVSTRERATYSAGVTIISAGASTPFLVPELKPFMKITGHPVFHITPVEVEKCRAPWLPVYTADISNTGWYGFPWHPEQGVVKMAKHSKGLELHPWQDDRAITDEEVREFREFRKESFPSLANAPLVYTRRCLYTDTLDGHFWIDHHPEVKGLAVSSGGSGHGMKMGPVIGEMTADMAEGKSHRFSERYRWRELNPDTMQVEEARYVENRKLN